jgi:thioredoxin-related protein
MLFTVALRLIILLINILNYEIRLSNVPKLSTYSAENTLLLFNNSVLLMVFGDVLCFCENLRKVINARRVGNVRWGLILNQVVYVATTVV